MGAAGAGTGSATGLGFIRAILARIGAATTSYCGQPRWQALPAASGVTQPHRLTHVPQRLLGELVGLFHPVRDDVADQSRVFLQALRALPDRGELGEHGVDHRLFAFETADAGAAASLLYPRLALLVGIHEVEVPYRTLLGLARVAPFHAC